MNASNCSGDANIPGSNSGYVLVLYDSSSLSEEATVGKQCSHLTGDHQEGPDRVSCILQRLILAQREEGAKQQQGPNVRIVERTFPQPPRELLEGVHDADYLEWLESAVAKQELKEIQERTIEQEQQQQQQQQQRKAKRRKRTNENTNEKEKNEKHALANVSDVPRPLTPLLLQHLFPEEWQRRLKDGSKDASMTRVSRGSYQTACQASASVIAAIDHVLCKRPSSPQSATNDRITAFCLTRPPGHHAGRKGYLSVAGGCGFCLLNHVCIGALHAFKQHGVKTAIVDIDVHHGNGSQDIIQNRFEQSSSPTRGNILYTSIHLAERFVGESDLDFFPGSGVDAEFESDAILNIPITPSWDVECVEDMRGKEREAPRHPNHCGRSGFRKLFEQLVLPKLRAFAPDLVILSSGFDGALGDEGNMLDGQPGMDLTPEDYAWITQQVLGECGKVVSVLEGGYGSWDASKQAYDRTLLSECALAHVRALGSTSQAGAGAGAGTGAGTGPDVVDVGIDIADVNVAPDTDTKTNAENGVDAATTGADVSLVTVAVVADAVAQ